VARLIFCVCEEYGRVKNAAAGVKNSKISLEQGGVVLGIERE